MINTNYSIKYNLVSPSFSGRNWAKSVQNCCDTFEFSDEIKLIKKFFNYAPINSSPLLEYKGFKNTWSGFSTENLEDVGGGYLIADCSTPLSTTGVRTCAVANFICEKLGIQALYHVHHETNVKRIEEFIRKFMADFDKINIVGGDQFKTVNTVKKILQASDNVNPYAKKTFYHTVSENPEIIACDGEVQYMKGKKGSVSFIQLDDYWY